MPNYTKLKSKDCTGCGRTLPRSEFYERQSGTGWISWRCKKCLNKQHLTRYQRRAKIFNTIKLAIGCIDCGYREHPAALDFDHTRDKSFGITSGWGRSMESIMTEIEKCVVRCSNCHRVKTWDTEHPDYINILDVAA